MGRIGAFDGLRAVACLAVIGFHSTATGLGAGWVGVDAFFVLSGYLITGLLLSERERTGRVRLTSFWIRRAGRLYPALLVLVVAGIAMARQLGDETHGYRLTAFLALSYLTNLWIGAGQGTGGGLGLTWSLAVEEQFYLFWPLALLVLRSRRSVVLGSLGLGACSLAAMLLTAQHEAWGRPAAYFFPHTRVWELLVGCLLAAASRRLPTGRVAAHAAWAGVAIATATVVAYNAGLGELAERHMILVMGPTVVATALLIVGIAGARTWVSQVLSWSPLVWIGRRSYGGYLFQVPVLLVLSHSPVALPSWLFFALAASVTFALAGASFRWVEEPIRQAVNRRLVTAPAPAAPSGSHPVPPPSPSAARPARASVDPAGTATGAIIDTRQVYEQ